MLEEKNVCKNRCECVRLLDNLTNNNRFVCFRFSPIFAITSTVTHTHTHMRKFHCLNVSKCYRNSNVHTLPPQQAACKCSAELNLPGDDNLEREVNYGANCHVTFNTLIWKGSLLSYFYSDFLKIKPTWIWNFFIDFRVSFTQGWVIFTRILKEKHPGLSFHFATFEFTPLVWQSQT